MTRLGIRSREDGQTMSEYAVILGVITPIIVLAIAALSEAARARIEATVGFLTGG